ncbi:efflux RND transporter permease subunit [Emcibacter nanhaiensis]|uniref:Efflux RND transporter permease subunit n=1 Tax=Emcibacter nanhaiensis TaxID=1505037 RepID=A0A501PQY2_9PROT|nr:efflux RND transporter permease subunit [Emcibacter nanhaiensis]TPD62655.1 efflux RND transporter permease subunit [Emcibacter nanhaiensis]
MNWTEKSLKNPAVVAVIVAIIFLFGAFSISKLPVQLFPNIEYPQVSIWTPWRAASPTEVESEITEPLEDILQGIPGLEELNVYSNQGGAWANLQFGISTNMDKTLLDVISRLNRMPPLPADADQPVLNMGGGQDSDRLIYYFIQKLPGNSNDVEDYMQYVNDTIIPRIESLEGVARVDNETNMPEEEVQIIFDPFKAAQLNIQIPRVAQLAGQSRDVSGGTIEEGRKRYTLRFQGRYTPEYLSNMILDWRDGTPIRLGDIADIKVQRGTLTDVGIQNGNPALSLNIFKEPGANTLATIERVNALADELNETILKEKGLTMQKSFDPSVFIKRAIGLLSSNLLIGVAFAVGILWWFLRQTRATFIIATTIPVCLLATFIVLQLTGRSLNVISLAGLAFATGMVLDAAIVVMENICRLREKGLKDTDACQVGAQQVWGALLASTATTVAIFIPVLFLEDVEGQLFADLALTIAIAVSFSLVVAVTILPVANKHFMHGKMPEDRNKATWKRISAGIMKVTNTPRKRYGWIFGLIGLSLLSSWLMFPKMDYLPPVKRDAVDMFLQIPPGTSSDVLRNEITATIVERLDPYMKGEKQPALKNYYILTWNGGQGGTIGIRAKDQGMVKELEKVVKEEITAGLPDVQAFGGQGNLFGGFGGNGSIEINVQSSDEEVLAKASARVTELIREVMPEAMVRAQQSGEQTQPQLIITPNDRRIQEAGWSRNEVARVVQTLGSGLYVGEYFDGDKRMNIILKTAPGENGEDIAAIPLATTSGGIMQLGELANVEATVGPQFIKRTNGRRTMSIDVVPPKGMALQEALEIIREKVEPAAREALGEEGSIIYGGSANQLKQAVNSLGTNFLLAFGLLFLILAALFKSPKDAALVVISIPLATVGGVAAIRLLNLITFQPLDLLTMIGFIILLGLVVNNAILLVVQTRKAESEGSERSEAVQTALELRMRPILMSTLTSIVGMLPLLMFPGEGSAIYRGLAASIVGGMTVSTIFTLLLMPSLLQLGRSNLRPKIVVSNRTYAQEDDKMIGVGE